MFLEVPGLVRLRDFGLEVWLSNGHIYRLQGDLYACAKVMDQWGGDFLVLHDTEDYPKGAIEGNERWHPVMRMARECTRVRILLTSSRGGVDSRNFRCDDPVKADLFLHMQSPYPDELAQM